MTPYANEPMSSYVFRVGRAAHLTELRLMELLGYPRPVLPQCPTVDAGFIDRLAMLGGRPRGELVSRLIRWTMEGGSARRLDTSYRAKGGTSCPHCRLLRGGAAQLSIKKSLEFVCPTHVTWTTSVPDLFGAGKPAYEAAFASTEQLMLLADTHGTNLVASSFHRSLKIVESYLRGHPAGPLRSRWDERSLLRPTQPQFAFHICFPEIVDLASAIVEDDCHLAHYRLTERVVNLIVHQVLG